MYRQLHCAQHALEHAFSPIDDEDAVLFHLPVTRAWLHMFALVLHLTCRASYRNIRRAMDLWLDTSMSMGSLHHLMVHTATQVDELHEHEPLEQLTIGAHDELFHAQRPILSGVDVPSGDCYLLELQDSCDANTWGVVLLELQDRGLELEQVVADGGKGLRAGHREAGYPQVDYDPFHLMQAATELVGDLRRRARRLHKHQCELERKMERAAKQGLQGRYSARLGKARQRARAAADLHEHVECLVQWLGQDLLAPSAMSPATRRHLYDWVVEQLREWEDACEQECLHRIGPVCRLLAHVAEDALAFAPRLHAQLEQLRQTYRLKREHLEGLVALVQSQEPSAYWFRYCRLRGVLGERLEAAEAELEEVLRSVVRTSREVESTHTRLRRSFRQRRHVDAKYLQVQRFVLNHSRLERSRVPGRQGRSPAEVLRGEELPHWLEQLGYERFRHAA